MALTDDEFRDGLRDLVARSGRSLRALSGAMGRDPGYVAALLDASRPSRARPTPDDLVRLSEATGLPLVEMLQSLWGIEQARLTAELAGLGVRGPLGKRLEALTDAERREVADFVTYLEARRSARLRERP